MAHKYLSSDDQLEQTINNPIATIPRLISRQLLLNTIIVEAIMEQGSVVRRMKDVACRIEPKYGMCRI
jgi:hypothetical protein